MPKRMNNLSAKKWLQYSFTIWRDIRKNKEETRLKHPAMFPTQLTSKLIEIYTKDRGEVILDPFFGSGGTIVSAVKLGRKAVGFELSKDYVDLTKKRLKSLQMSIEDSDKKLLKPDIYNKDARDMLNNLKPNSVDLCITSPPYWDILKQKRTADGREIRSYGDSEKDLGNISNYEIFLEELKDIFNDVYVVLKQNKRCVVVVMDIRKKSKFYPFHIDLTKIMKEIGFDIEEFVIWDRQHEYNYCRPLGYPYVFRFNKMHEFICIYHKV